MRAPYWNGVNDLRVGTVPDPTIVNPHDAILRAAMSTTCGPDLHFIDGYIPTMKPGDVIGREFTGEVVETGPEVKYVPRLLEHAAKGELDTSYLATRKFSLEGAPRGYSMSKHKEGGCVRAVFTP